MASNSYIKLYRSIMTNWVSEEKPFDTFHAWVWLLMNANFKTTKREYRGQLQTVERGELVTSYDALAAAWGWSRNKVMRYTTKLQNEGMITKKCNNTGTAITIEKYGFYQDGRYKSGTVDETVDGTVDGTHYKKRKESKEGPTRAHAREGGAAAEWRRRKEANGDD